MRTRRWTAEAPWATSWRQDLALLLLRAGLAFVFLFSGLEKVIRGNPFTTSWFSTLGIAWPEVTGPAVAWVELLGAIALLAGLLARVAGTLLAADMLVALLAIRIPAATHAPSVVDAVASVRLELVLALTAASIVLLGSGKWSADWLLGERKTVIEASEEQT